MPAPIDLTATLDAEFVHDANTSAPNPTQSQDAVIDVLYENQRGAWFCGLPLFSSASLLNFDPAAWVNANGKASPVNVTNAQTPDPSWQWAWPTWYVDMSQDVDEEGWQYSIMFRRATVWHGTHPWFHSFVRRRRWVRMRRKARKRQAHEHASEGRRAAETSREGHLLNADYFTIHPTKTAERGSMYAASMARTLSSNRLNLRTTEIADEPPEEIDSLQTLFHALRAARVDREKINIVLQFLDQGGQDIYYLSEQMNHILSLFMFQYTRRQLLSRMLQKIGEASDHRVEHRKEQKEEYQEEKEKIDNLLRAVRAAEDEVKALEYWSDISDMAQAGETMHAANDNEGWDAGWQGLDQSGAHQAKAPETDEHGHIQRT